MGRGTTTLLPDIYHPHLLRIEDAFLKFRNDLQTVAQIVFRTLFVASIISDRLKGLSVARLAIPIVVGFKPGRDGRCHIA